MDGEAPGGIGKRKGKLFAFTDPSGGHCETSKFTIPKLKSANEENINAVANAGPGLTPSENATPAAMSTPRKGKRASGWTSPRRNKEAQ
ncbi:unnamed protein product, partial [Chrysoparadoxa australica]